MKLGSVIATINAGAFQDICARYASITTPDRREKYLDLDYWIRVGIERAQRLGLDAGPRRRILDLGCGCGYFLYVCKLLGHEVVGLDCPEDGGMYTEVRALLGIPWVAHEITSFGRLPDLAGPFDVVTAHMICFNGHRSWSDAAPNPAPNPSVWGPSQWAHLLLQIAAPLIYLELNAEEDGLLFPPGLREFFIDLGARIDEHRVTIELPPWP